MREINAAASPVAKRNAHRNANHSCRRRSDAPRKAPHATPRWDIRASRGRARSPQTATPSKDRKKGVPAPAGGGGGWPRGGETEGVQRKTRAYISTVFTVKST